MEEKNVVFAGAPYRIHESTKGFDWVSNRKEIFCMLLERASGEINKYFFTFNFLLIPFLRLNGRYRQGKYYAIYMITTSECERVLCTAYQCDVCSQLSSQCYSRFMFDFYDTGDEGK